MASSQDFVDFVLDQFDPALDVSARKMFGEYGVYSGGKMFALICDDRLFIKKTEEAAEFAGDLPEAPPYPGAKPIWVIEDRLEDTPWLSELTRRTVEALPLPKKKRKKST